MERRAGGRLGTGLLTSTPASNTCCISCDISFTLEHLHPFWRCVFFLSWTFNIIFQLWGWLFSKCAPVWFTNDATNWSSPRAHAWRKWQKNRWDTHTCSYCSLTVQLFIDEQERESFNSFSVTQESRRWQICYTVYWHLTPLINTCCVQHIVSSCFWSLIWDPSLYYFLHTCFKCDFFFFFCIYKYTNVLA